MNEQNEKNEYHVSLKGDDSNSGSGSAPLRTIQAAAMLAQPGDTITVHAGVYRERIDPPRGGESNEKRIVYQAAPGEKVSIKGSEVIKDWKHQDGNVWMVTIPHAYFGAFNPYTNLLIGDWFFPQNREHHTGAVYLNDVAINEAAKLDELFDGAARKWFTKSTTWETKIWANFGGADPREEQVEINKRQTVFYPSKSGMNYITVRGFTLSQGATPWSPPTTEQIGLIGVNWSKGWIIENNTITHSRSTGITLGKYFDREDGKIEYGFNAHYQTVKRVLERGDWTPENIGDHIIRNNHIAYCEQSGIVGSHGGAFCTIIGNVIHDIHLRQLFSGFEQAGIKLHAPVDTVISNNLIFNCNMGIWMDWMSQGTRISNNTLYGNQQWDIFMEISHGPFVVDNNWLMSKISLLDSAQGGAYFHNMFGGLVRQREEAERSTQYFKPHSTELVGDGKVLDGDERFYNNIFLEDSGLQSYDKNQEELWMDGNVFLYKAKPCRLENEALCDKEADTRFYVETNGSQVNLQLNLKADWVKRNCQQVTTERLGKTKLVGLGFEKTDGTPIIADQDYFGNARNAQNPFPGPFELSDDVTQVTIWPPNDKVRTINDEQQEVEEYEVEPR